MRMPGSTKVRATLALLLFGCALRWALSSWASPRTGAADPARHALHDSGILSYEVRDAQTQKPIPAKLTFIGIRGTADPALSPGDVGRPEGDAIAAYNRVMSSTGLGALHVPAGHYDIYVSRGLEWDSVRLSDVVIGSTPATIRTELHHVLDTRGWISADFHVHSACSPDSRVSLRDRVYEFLSDGIDMIVATDHNVVCDYAPYIQELGAESQLLSALGDEITTAGWGHYGLFPMPQQLNRAGHGAVHVAGRNADEIFAHARAEHPRALLTIHHPRIDAEIGYFNLAGFDSTLDRATREGFSFDFDALEVLNGYQDAERKHIDRAIHDWLSLLNFGHLITATGNSDTHHLNYNIGGYPRNYVRVTDDSPLKATPEEVAGSVRSHHSFFTTGPFIRMDIDGADIGDLAPPRRAQPMLSVEVSAAPWVSVSRLILYINGREAMRLPIPPSQKPTRLVRQIPLNLPPSQDAYVVVRVDGDQVLAPIVGDRSRFDVRPLLLTNPIFLDMNRNGRFDPQYSHGAHTPKKKRRWFGRR